MYYIAPGLAAGCPIIWKPATSTAAVCSAFMKCIEDAKVPAGFVSMVIGSGPVAVSYTHLVTRHDLLVYSDEVYEKIIYEGCSHYSIAQLPDMMERTIVINSFSKTYAMTGWRIGYLLADGEIVGQMPKIQEGIASCLAAFVQKAAVAALNGPNEPVQQMVNDYTRRRSILIDGLNQIPGFRCQKSPGTFYAFPNIKAFGKSSQEFAEELLREARVVTVPGSAFGSMGEGFLRLSFANSDENLREAVRRIAEHIRKKY